MAVWLTACGEPSPAPEVPLATTPAGDFQVDLYVAASSSDGGLVPVKSGVLQIKVRADHTFSYEWTRDLAGTPERGRLEGRWQARGSSGGDRHKWEFVEVSESSHPTNRIPVQQSGGLPDDPRGAVVQFPPNVLSLPRGQWLFPGVDFKTGRLDDTVLPAFSKATAARNPP